jgi:hypothetical protein
MHIDALPHTLEHPQKILKEKFKSTYPMAIYTIWERLPSVDV